MIDTVVVDLDNTLWDWVGMWHATFRAELDKILEISGLDEAQLKSDIRAVHQRYGTSEFAFLIEQLPSLRRLHPGANLLELYAPAIDTFREVRRRVLALYPTVAETLNYLQSNGTMIAAYTESQAFYTGYRVRKLGLEGKLAYLYSPADHDMPPGLAREEVRKYPKEAYEMAETIHRHTPTGELKPNPDILLTIIRELGSDPQRTIYVGDSLMKDVAMAQDAGVIDVYAEYGNVRDSAAYQLLREVTHWTNRDVERERRIHARGEVTPSYVAVNTFGEIVKMFNYTSHERHCEHRRSRA